MENSKPVPKVLFADDVLESRMIVEIILKKAGCAVTSCVDGREAAQYAEKEKFDAIILDVQMPVMNGIEAAGRIRSGQLNRHTPMLALTAGDTKEDTLMCLNAGFDDHLSKPVQNDILRRKIEKYVRQSHAVQVALTGGDIISLLAEDGEYQKIVETFFDSLPTRITEMKDAFEKGFVGEFAAKVHSLKGVGGLAGFPIYTEKAKELEEMLHSNRLEEVKRLLEELTDLCRRTLNPKSSEQSHP
jgi:CheY-like chemotaxis protein